MAANGRNDVIELDGDTSEEEELECWTGKKPAAAPKQKSSEATANVGRGCDAKPRGKASVMSIPKPESRTYKDLAEVQAALQAKKRSRDNSSADNTSNAISLLSEGRPSSKAPTASFKSMSSGGLAPHYASGSKSSSLGATGRQSSNTGTYVYRGKQHGVAGGRVAKRNCDSEDEDALSDNPFGYAIHDRNKRPVFGQQRCTVGSNYEEAISIQSDSDDDDARPTVGGSNNYIDLVSVLPKTSHASPPFLPTNYAAVQIRRKKREKALAVAHAQNSSSKHGQHKSTHLNALDANTVASARECNQSGVAPNGGPRSVNPVHRLRVVPSHGRSSRALRGPQSQSPTKPASILNKGPPSPDDYSVDDAEVMPPLSHEHGEDDDEATSVSSSDKDGKKPRALGIVEKQGASLTSSNSSLALPETKMDSKSWRDADRGLLHVRDGGVAQRTDSGLSSVSVPNENAQPRNEANQNTSLGEKSDHRPPQPTDYSTIFEDDNNRLEQDEDVAKLDLRDPTVPALGNWCASVEHLSRKSMDPITNLPIWEFAVHTGDDCKLRPVVARSLGRSSLPVFLFVSGAMN